MSLDTPASLAGLLAGDPLERAVYAAAAGRPGAMPPAPERVETLVALLATLGDGYPTVRHIARQSLLSLDRQLPLGIDAALAGYDPLRTDAAGRQALVRRLLSGFHERASGRLRGRGSGLIVGAGLRPDLQAIVRLLEQQSSKVISIGE